MNKNIRILFYSTIAYITICAIVILFPHSEIGFGKMNLHQGFASIGKILTFGLVDLTLVDWYMVSNKMSENIVVYNRVVNESLIKLSFVYIFWFWLVSVLSNKVFLKNA